jgi:predicted CopG family antitoxin
MGKQKSNLVKSVSLGEPGSPPRILAEMYVKKYGNKSFSELIRRLIMIFLSDREEYKDWKKKVLIYERKELQKQVPDISKKLCENAEQLGAMGVDIDNI